MRKHGFTLAEALIAMSIIAISAAMIAPMLKNIAPDRSKLRVLQSYQLANEATERLLENHAIYYRDPVGNGTLTNCDGLECTQQPANEAAPFNTSAYTGTCKYPNLMIAIMNLKDISSCSASSPTASGNAANRIHWTISFVSNGNYLIEIDLDGVNNGVGHVYDSTHKNPDKFQFNVDKFGDITGVDALSQVYIRNMTNTYKSDDYAELQ